MLHCLVLPLCSYPSIPLPLLLPCPLRLRASRRTCERPAAPGAPPHAPQRALLGGSTIDQYLEGMDASMGTPGLTSSIDSFPSQGHGPMGAPQMGMGMGMGMERTMGGIWEAALPCWGFERIRVRVLHIFSKLRATLGGWGHGGRSWGVLGVCWGASRGRGEGAQGGGSRGRPSTLRPLPHPGSYGTGLPASRGTRGAPGGCRGACRAGAGGAYGEGRGMPWARRKGRAMGCLAV